MAKGGSPSKASGEDAAPFGGRLRRLREAAGLSQEELAGRAGLTAKAISMLERGQRKRPYPHTVRALADALGLPEGERTVLTEAIPGRSDDAPLPDKTATTYPSALPASLTPLLGREREVEEITGLLATVKLLTLTGPGGIGKTRLGIEAARKAGGYFPGGVAFIALAPVGDAALVVPTVSRVLGLREVAGVPPLEVLCRHLRERRFLLVLDNFEHVTEAAPEVADLLGYCPNLSVLVTSRAPLRVRGEREYPVSPLAVPDPSRTPETMEVAESPAARLFVERAGEASPVFELTQANAVAVAAICWKLDGLPLALELAAARTRFLGPTALLSRLDQALESGGARDLPERQRTMRATLDWSHELLHEPEKELFRRLSVFAGGFTLEAAEDVCAGDAVEAEEVLVLVGNLVEQSLVVAETSKESDKLRYRMLEPVRQYALDRLEDGGGADEARRRHAAYYLALAERIGPGLKGPGQAAGVRRLETELDNLRAALRWSIDHGEAEAVARVFWESWTYWWSSGQQVEGRRWMEEALASGSVLSAPARAKLLFVAATFAQGGGDWEAARVMIEESLAIFRREDEGGVAQAMGTAGLVALGQERYEEGTTLLEESAEMNLRTFEWGRWAAAALLGFASSGALSLGDLPRARRLGERALALARQVGANDVIFVALYVLAAVARTEGNDEEAVRLFREGLEISAEVGEMTNVAYCLEGLAAVAASEEGPERAARIWGAAEAILETIEVVAYSYTPDRSVYRSLVAAAREQLDEQRWEQAWAQGREMGFEEAVAYALGEEALPPAPP